MKFYLQHVYVTLYLLLEMLISIVVRSWDEPTEGRRSRMVSPNGKAKATSFCEDKCMLSFFFFQSWWRILSTHTSTPTRMREKLLWKRKPAAKRYYLLSISWSNDREYFMIANSKIPFLYILMLVAIYLCNMDLSPLVYKHKRKKLHIAL